MTEEKKSGKTPSISGKPPSIHVVPKLAPELLKTKPGGHEEKMQAQMKHTNPSSTNRSTKEFEGPLPADEWIRIWNKSSTLEDFCRLTGMESGSASARASYYRRRLRPLGVELKSLGVRGRARIDYGAIAREIQDGLDRDKK